MNTISNQYITFVATVCTTVPIETVFQDASFYSIFKVTALPLCNANLAILFKIIVPALHTVRSAGGSFFLYTYAK